MKSLAILFFLLASILDAANADDLNSIRNDSDYVLYVNHSREPDSVDIGITYPVENPTGGDSLLGKVF